MLGFSAEKLIVIALICVFVVGPERLPRYAAKLAAAVRALRRMADAAQVSVREELGPEFDEIDWKKLNPRQYDPRRIVREALLEDPVDLNESDHPSEATPNNLIGRDLDSVPVGDGEPIADAANSAQ